MNYLQLLELHPGGLSTSASLQPGKDGSDLELTLLLHPATDSGPEEDLGVAKPELLLVQLDDVHHGSGGCLVVLCLRHSCRTQNVVATLELRIVDLYKTIVIKELLNDNQGDDLVRESSTTDGDSSQDTVALVLVHDQAGLHASGLLVGVGHHAADEVGLGLVEDGHQVVELAHEVGGHVLPPLPFSCPGPLEPPGVDQGGP